MSAPDDFLDAPPFPAITWTEYDWWEGTACLPAWADFTFNFDDTEDVAGEAMISLTPLDPTVSRLPSEAQVRAFRYQVENGAETVASVLEALHRYYLDLRPKYAASPLFGAEEFEEAMPLVEDSNDFRRLIQLRHVHVNPWQREGIAYIGLQFDCSWDEEHDFGVQLHASRVAAIGDADASFAWEPEEADGS